MVADDRLHAYIRGSGCRIHLTPCIAAFSVQYTGVSAHAGVSRVPAESS
jgi:hypothetical protein